MNDFSIIRTSIEKLFEDAFVEILSINSKKGLPILVDPSPAITEVLKLIDSSEEAYFSERIVIIPSVGGRHNED